MKTLVIHPKDCTTDFLHSVAPLSSTVVRTNISDALLLQLIKAHDIIIMLGHGDSKGLFGFDRYVIDSSFVQELRNKLCVCVWCYASDFIKDYGLKTPFSTGMFISELEEAFDNDLLEVRSDELEWSNIEFAENLGYYITVRLINGGWDSLIDDVKDSYMDVDTDLKIFNSTKFYSNYGKI